MLGSKATHGTLLLPLRTKDGRGIVRLAAVNAVESWRVTLILGMGALTFKAQGTRLKTGDTWPKCQQRRHCKRRSTNRTASWRRRPTSAYFAGRGDSYSTQIVVELPIRRMLRIGADARIIPKRDCLDSEASTCRTMLIDVAVTRGSMPRTAIPHNEVSWRRDCVVWPFLVSTARIVILFFTQASRVQDGCRDTRASDGRTKFKLSNRMSGVVGTKSTTKSTESGSCR